jgi:hypothetical protein
MRGGLLFGRSPDRHWQAAAPREASHGDLKASFNKRSRIIIRSAILYGSIGALTDDTAKCRPKGTVRVAAGHCIINAAAPQRRMHILRVDSDIRQQVNDLVAEGEIEAARPSAQIGGNLVFDWGRAGEIASGENGVSSDVDAERVPEWLARMQ